jgi:hypothetical protein
MTLLAGARLGPYEILSPLGAGRDRSPRLAKRAAGRGEGLLVGWLPPHPASPPAGGRGGWAR